jgi:hypothetical protein
MHATCSTFNRGLTTVRRYLKLRRPAAPYAEESRLGSEPEGGTILQPVVPAIPRLHVPLFSKISDEYENLDVPADSEIAFPVSETPGSCAQS